MLLCVFSKSAAASACKRLKDTLENAYQTLPEARAMMKRCIALVLVHQLNAGKLRNLTAGRSVDDHAPERRQAFQALLGNLSSHHLQNNVAPLPSRRVFDLLNPVVFSIINGGIGPQLAYQIDFAAIAGGSDNDTGAHEFCKLYRKRPHAPCRRVHQDALAGLDLC